MATERRKRLGVFMCTKFMRRFNRANALRSPKNEQKATQLSAFREPKITNHPDSRRAIAKWLSVGQRASASLVYNSRMDNSPPADTSTTRPIAAARRHASMFSPIDKKETADVVIDIADYQVEIGNRHCGGLVKHGICYGLLK